MEKKSRGQYRKDAYALFEKLVGRQMTEDEHVELKTLMVEYLRDHQMDFPAPATKIDYTFTCKKCQMQTAGKGKDFRKKMMRKDRTASVVSAE
jgi:hypothetical protein